MKEKCLACNGTGYVEGEHYDDLQGCHNCLGSGYFEYQTESEILLAIHEFILDKKIELHDNKNQYYFQIGVFTESLLEKSGYKKSKITT